MTVLLDCILLCIAGCQDEVELAHWWGQHRAALRALSEEEWQLVWAAKETRRGEYRRAFEERMKADRAAGEARPSFWGSPEG